MEKCFYCERPFGVALPHNEKPLIKTKDHIIPYSRGGKNQADNIVICCGKCNALKADLTLKEFVSMIHSMLSKKHLQHWNGDYLRTVKKNAEKLISRLKRKKKLPLKTGVTTILPPNKRVNLNRLYTLSPDQVVIRLSEDWQRTYGNRSEK